MVIVLDLPYPTGSGYHIYSIHALLPRTDFFSSRAQIYACRESPKEGIVEHATGLQEVDSSTSSLGDLEHLCEIFQR